MSKGIELTLSQIEAYERGATMFLFPCPTDLKTRDIMSQDLGFNMLYPDYISKYIEVYSPIQVGDEDIFIQEEFKIGYWNSKTYQMAFDYRIGKNTQLKYQNVEPFNKMVEDSIKQLKAKNIKPNKYGNYKWEKFDSPLDWYSASKMTKDQSRYSFVECIDVKLVKIQDIPIEDLINILGEINLQSLLVEAHNNILGHFKEFYNQQLQEQNINRTYEDNDYIFLIKFKR